MNTPVPTQAAGPPVQRGSCLVVAVVALALLGALFVLAVVASFLILPILMESRGGGERHQGVGQRLSRLELYSLTVEGQVLTLPDLDGRVVLLNFWGTWCPPCREELPHIAAIERKFRGQNSFQLLAVSCGRGVHEALGELRRETKAFLDQQNIDMPTYADPNSITRTAVDEAVGFEGYPTTLVLDRQGIIGGIWVGYQSGVEREMEALLDRLLAE